jgi:hypothetical protein
LPDRGQFATRIREAKVERSGAALERFKTIAFQTVFREPS